MLGQKLNDLALTKDPDKLYDICDAHACDEDSDMQFEAIENGIYAGIKASGSNKEVYDVMILDETPQQLDEYKISFNLKNLDPKNKKDFKEALKKFRPLLLIVNENIQNVKFNK